MNQNHQTDVAPPNVRAKVRTPALARMVLRIGITGHRPNNLRAEEIAAICAKIQMVLKFLQETSVVLHSKASGTAYLDEKPVLRLISPLAEGADRLFVQTARDLDEEFDLQCPLPFAKEEYEKDFGSRESQAQFRELLSTASSVLELDGNPEARERSQAYEAVGRMVLSHSDIVVTVWDGDESDQRGGTSQMVSEAQVLGIPLIWINARPPHGTCIKLNESDEWIVWQDAARVLTEKLEALLMPPSAPQSSDSGKRTKPDLRMSYFKERKRSSRLLFPWKLFIRLAAIGTGRRTLPSESPVELPKDIAVQIDSALGSHYESADRLASFYSNVYRSAFVFNYFMAAAAVFFAFVGFVIPEHHRVQRALNVIEVAIILGIIFVTYFGTKRRWHERWIEYRFLAEHLRQTEFLMTLGRASVSVLGSSAHLPYGDPRNTWMYWHLRAVVRESGMIRACFTSTYLEQLRDFYYQEGIQGQIGYHEANAERFRILNERLHRFGFVLFLLAFAAAFLHFFTHEATWLTMLTIVGPAFGSSMAAIRSQGEFERLMKRSRATSSQLKILSRQLTALRLRDGDLSSQSLSDILLKSAEVMVKDVLDWRTVVQDKPLDWA